MNTAPQGVAKTHPATREVLPDDPMELSGFEVPGDPGLMLRLVVEEYARMGFDAAALLRLARDPNYQALHGLWRHFGEQGLASEVARTLERCGVLRATTREAPRPPESGALVQLDPIFGSTRREFRR
jgi:hypothetical protein